MTVFLRQKVKRLAKVNSVDFVNTVFRLYTAQELFAIDSGDDMTDAILRDHDGGKIRPKKGGGWFDTKFEPAINDSPAQIVFSSGTEGNPKAIVISQRALANVVSRLNDIMKLDESVREYIGVPVTYSFGLGRCRAIATVGGCGFIPENGFNLVEIKSMLEKGEINAISAVPSLWRKLLAKTGYLGRLGDRVKWIEIGSQYMSADEKKQMKNIFPNAKIVQHYGLTEASRSTILDITSTENELESIGAMENQGIAVRLNAENRIQIKGEHIALGQLAGDEIRGITDDQGWFTTGDIGSIVNGYLYYEGRYDDIVNCGGIKVNPDFLQQQINDRLEGLYEVAIAGIPDDNRGEGFFVAVNTQSFDLEQLKGLVNSILVTMDLNAIDAVRIAYVENFPRTETGKIKRKELAAKYRPEDCGRDEIQESRSLLGKYINMFPASNVSRKSCFQSLGGDSLNYVEMSMEIESFLGVLPENWENIPIGELEKLPKKESGFWVSVEASIILRAIAIICIVLSHSGLKMIGGGTFLLFLLVGTNFARFQFVKLVNNDYQAMMARYILRLLIPYMALVLVYSLWTQELELGMLFLYQNLYDVYWTIIFPFWFVQVLVQCLLIIGVLFSIRGFRQFIARHKWRSSFIVLLAFVAIRVIYPHFWMPAEDLVPLRIIALIWLGWTLYLCEGQIEKAVTVTIGVLLALYDCGLESKLVWLILGCLIVPYVPRIPVPRGVDWVLKNISAATFYIFIFNGVAVYVTGKVFGIDAVLVNFVAAMSLSIVMWLVFEQIVGKKISEAFIKSEQIKTSENGAGYECSTDKQARLRILKSCRQTEDKDR